MKRSLPIPLLFLVGALVLAQCGLEYVVRKTQSVMDKRLAACQAVLRRAMPIALDGRQFDNKATRHFVGTYFFLGRSYGIGDFPRAFYSRFHSPDAQVLPYSERHEGNDREWNWTLLVTETGPDSYSIEASYSCSIKGCFAMCEYTITTLGTELVIRGKPCLGAA